MMGDVWAWALRTFAIRPEREAEIDRRKNGIPIVDAVVKDLNELAEKLSVSPLTP